MIHYIYLNTSCKCNGEYVLICICLCLKCEHVVERTFQSITQEIWVFSIIIYHHLCHHPKSAFSSYMFIQFIQFIQFIHLTCLYSLQIRLQVGLHERRFSTASGAEELDIHSSFYLSIENPAAIIIRTRDIRTDNQTPVTYACLIFGMLVYSYLRMMPFLSLEIFISHVNDFGQYKRHVNSWSAS